MLLDLLKLKMWLIATYVQFLMKEVTFQMLHMLQSLNIWTQSMNISWYLHCNNKTVLILMKTKHLEDALKPKDTDTPVSNVNTRDVHWTMLPTSSVDTYPSDWKPCDLGRTVVLILETRSYDLHTTRSTTSPSINRLDYWFRWIKHLMWSIEVLLFVYTRSLWGFIIQ